jgi:nitroimidazol reductase NimA-like FMN-containing flavoprotein (pyridoxamine 5'-phosphate oxidase superfamily)
MTETEPKAAQPLIDDAAVSAWTVARERLEKADSYWLATERPDGRPHLMPVLALWHDGALYFCASPTSRKGRNLTRNSHCVIASEAHDSDLVVEGEADQVSDEAKLNRVAELYASKYDWRVKVRDGAFYGDGAPTAGPPPYGVYEVTPTVVFAFCKDGSISPTRWRF